MDFRGQNLTNADFSAANLTNGDFTNAILSGAKFQSANLTGADFSGVNIGGFSFKNAILRFAVLGGSVAQTDFTGADLFGVRATGVAGVPDGLPRGWLLRAGRLIGPGVDLTGATLTNNDLFKADLTGVRSGGVTSRNDPQLPPHWALVDGYLIGPGADLTGADLTNTDLTQVSNGPFTGSPRLPRGWVLAKSYLFGPGSEVKDADLTGANLESANLQGSHIWQSNLSGANLGNANLRRTSFAGSNISNANFHGAWLVGTLFTGTSNLNGADFSKARFKEVYGCGIGGTPLLPDGWKQIGDDLVGPSVQLSNCDLRNGDFTNANLSGARISSTKVDRANFSNAIMTGIRATNLSGTPAALPKGWAIVNKTLVGPEANLSDCEVLGNLKGVDLSHANLYHARVMGDSDDGQVKLPTGWKWISGAAVGPGANINGVNLSGADLSDTNLSGVIGYVGQSRNVKLPKGWALIQGRLVGPGADLTDAVLPGADLSKLAISGVRGRISNYVGMTLPSGWVVRSGYLLGKTADLSNVQASGLDLAGVDLSLANLNGSRLTNVKGLPNLPPGFATVSGAIVGPGVDMSGFECMSDLGTIKLSGANLTSFKCSPRFAKSVDFSNALTDDKDVYLPEGWVVDDNGVILGKITNAPKPLVIGVFENAKTLHITAGTWPSGVTLTFQWLRDGVAIPNATASNYTLTKDDVDKKISILVTGEKSGFQRETAVSAQAVVAPGTQILTPTPEMLGSFKVGQKLSTNQGVWDRGASLKYQWLRNGVAIPGETDSILNLGPADFGQSLSVQVTGSITGFKDLIKISTSTKVSAGSMPIAAPKVAGTAKVGSTIKSLVSPWVSGAKITYKWFANGVQIKGQTSSSLKLLAAQKGKKITVEVTQAATGYLTATKGSASVTVK